MKKQFSFGRFLFRIIFLAACAIMIKAAGKIIREELENKNGQQASRDAVVEVGNGNSPQVYGEVNNTGVLKLDSESQNQAIADLIVKEVGDLNTEYNVYPVYQDSDMDRVLTVYQSVYRNHPEFFWLSGSGEVGVTKQNGIIISCMLKCEAIIDMKEVSSMRAKLEKKVASIVEETEKNCTTDYEKALYVHDYLVKNCEYDSDLLELSKGLGELDYTSVVGIFSQDQLLSYTSYGCIINQVAVCDGYSKAYMQIMNELGVECGYIYGTADNGDGSMGAHAWNYIKLDGEYYLVDVTWDDPVGQKEDYCRWDYFCVTSVDMDKDHFPAADSFSPECTNAQYMK